LSACIAINGLTDRDK